MAKMVKMAKMKKKAIELDALGWIILGIIFLVVAIAIIIILSGKGSGAIGKILDLIRFGK